MIKIMSQNQKPQTLKGFRDFLSMNLLTMSKRFVIIGNIKPPALVY